MKTEVILHRGLQDFVVMQRSKTGMFNATDLVRQWNLNNPNNKKDVREFFKLKSTSELIESIVIEENLNDGNSTHLKLRGKYGGTWMHPILFIDFAMWLNTNFKYHVLKWVSDNLLAFRNDAGDNYIQLTKCVKSIGIINFPKLATSINFIVYGKHERDIRNISNEEQLQELNVIQSNIIFSINSGLVLNENQLFNMLRRLYRTKYTPKCLT